VTVVTWEEYQVESTQHVLALQDALQRLRRAQDVGVPADQADLDLLRPVTSYKGGNLDRLWASEEY